MSGGTTGPGGQLVLSQRAMGARRAGDRRATGVRQARDRRATGGQQARDTRECPSRPPYFIPFASKSAQFCALFSTFKHPVRHEILK